MEIKLGRKELVNVLKRTKRIYDCKSPLPILQCVLLEVFDDVRMLATNLETDSIVRLKDTEFKAPKSKMGICVQGSKLLTYADKAKGDYINIDFLENEKNNTVYKTVLTTENKKDPKVTLEGYDMDEFPKFYCPADVKLEAIVNRTKFMDMLETSLISIAKEEPTREALECVLIESKKDNEINITTTDGRTLFTGEVNPDEPIIKKEFQQAIIQGNNIKDMLKALEISERELEIRIDSQRIFLSSGDIVASSRLREEQYPNYKRVIMDKFDMEVEVNRDELKDALLTLKTVDTGKDTPNMLYIEVKDKMLNLMCKNEDGESTEFDIECMVKNDTLKKVAVNTLFLLRAIQKVEFEQVNIKLNEVHPGLIRLSNNSIYCLMPIEVIKREVNQAEEE